MIIVEGQLSWCQYFRYIAKNIGIYISGIFCKAGHGMEKRVVFSFLFTLFLLDLYNYN